MAKRNPTQMMGNIFQMVALESRDLEEILIIARVSYWNRQDCNLIGGSRVPGETEEWITSMSYLPILFSIGGHRLIVSIGGNHGRR